MHIYYIENSPQTLEIISSSIPLFITPRPLDHEHETLFDLDQLLKGIISFTYRDKTHYQRVGGPHPGRNLAS